MWTVLEGKRGKTPESALVLADGFLPLYYPSKGGKDMATRHDGIKLEELFREIAGDELADDVDEMLLGSQPVVDAIIDWEFISGWFGCRLVVRVGGFNGGLLIVGLLLWRLIA